MSEEDAKVIDVEATVEDGSVKISEVVLVPIENLEENAWNPNSQSEQTFNQLVDEINSDGFQDPLLIVPVVEGKVDAKKDKFRIIGGAHRFRVAGVLEMKEVPCFIKEGWSEAEQKLKTVRRNLISGRLDDAKFTALVASLKEGDGLTDEELPILLGFDDTKEYAQHLIQTVSADGDAEAWVDTAEETSKELSAVDSISDVLNNIFTSYGETVPQSFMFFAHKGKTHLMVMMDDKMYALTEKMVEKLKVTKVNINDHMKEVFETYEAVMTPPEIVTNEEDTDDIPEVGDALPEV